MRARRLQSLIALILAVSLAAMGLAAATARGQTAAGGRIVVLCSGGGIVQATLDAGGIPTGQSHLCPDLALSLLAAISLAPPAVARPDSPAEPLAARTPGHAAFTSPAATRARGPPVQV